MGLLPGPTPHPGWSDCLALGTARPYGLADAAQAPEPQAAR
ncbi:hypothetical protein [Streptomyces sp. GESEQ-13]